MDTNISPAGMYHIGLIELHDVLEPIGVIFLLKSAMLKSLYDRVLFHNHTIKVITCFFY